MKSSTGQYFRSLDHVRALAAFLVFAWHFNHIRGGQNEAPLGPGLSFLTEGHTGVAIFMALSGYIFAKLLDGRTVYLVPFLWNRFLRLVPLLFIVIMLVAVEQALHGNLSWDYAIQILRGLVQPTLPNGGWSITVEAHFYVLLPVLLALGARNANALFAVLAAAVALRLALYFEIGRDSGSRLLDYSGQDRPIPLRHPRLSVQGSHWRLLWTSGTRWCGFYPPVVGVRPWRRILRARRHAFEYPTLDRRANCRGSRLRLAHRLVR